MTDINFAALDAASNSPQPVTPPQGMPGASAPKIDFAALDAQAHNNTVTNLSINLGLAKGTNPDDEASRMRTAKLLDVPVSLVPNKADTFDELRSKYLQADQIAGKAPLTAAWMARDPQNTAVTGLNVPGLMQVESAMHGAPAPVPVGRDESMLHKIGMGISGLSASFLSGVPSFNSGMWGYARAAADVTSEVLTGPLANVGILPEDIGAKMSAKFKQMQDIQKGYSDAGIGAGTDTLGGSSTAAGVASGMQSLGQNLLTLPFAIGTKGPQAALGVMSSITGGQSYGQAKDAGLGTVGSLNFAAQQQSIEYLTELMPAVAFMKALPKGYVSAVSHFLYKEVLGEQIATAAQDFNEWVDLNPQKTLGDYMRARPDAAYQTLIATVVGGGGALVLAKSADVMAGRKQMDDIQAADSLHTKLATMSTAAATNEVRARSHEAFHDLVSLMAEGGDMPEVYVDAKTLGQAFNDAGINQEELKAKMPDVAAQLPEAQATNGDVHISTADYLTYIAGSKADEVLLPHLRATADGMPYAQVQTARASLAADMQALAAKIDAESAKTDAAAADVASVHDQITQALAATGQVTPAVASANATPIAEFYATQAKRMGITPSELYTKMPYKVSGTALSGAQLDQSGSTILNVGLKASTALGGADISTEEATKAIEATGVKVLGHDVHISDSEPTMVAKLSRPLTPEEAHAVSVALRQDAIAQRNPDGTGVLHGPRAAEWGDYNPDYFLMPNGERASALGQSAKQGALTDGTQLPEVGTPTPGSTTVVGVHYSATSRRSLNGGFFGTGLASSEKARLTGAEDPRIEKRLYFYVPEGQGVHPEPGVGGVAHGAVLHNLYDVSRDHLGIWKANTDKNNFESAVLNHGFAGFYVPGAFKVNGKVEGAVTLLGDNAVKPKVLGTTEQANTLLGSTNSLPGAGTPLREIALAVANNTKIPGGRQQLSDWANSLERVEPELYAKVKATGAFEHPSTGALYKDELAKLILNTESFGQRELAHDEHRVAQEAMDYVEKHLPEAKAAYLKKAVNEHGVVVIDVDEAREVFPAYAKDKESRAKYAAAVHDAASTLAKAVYADVVREPVKPGHVPVVVFTGGGTGSGKSSVKDVAHLGEAVDKAHAVYDSTMSSFESSKARIDLALNNGLNAQLIHVARDPVEALIKGALPRAEDNGRTAPIAAHARTHVGAVETIKQLAEHYKGDPRVAISIIDNRGAAGEAKLASVDILSHANYNELKASLSAALDKEYQNGTISKQTYEGSRIRLPGVQQTSSGGVHSEAEQARSFGQSEADHASAVAFYSQLARVFEGAKQNPMPASQWAAWLKSNAGKLGVKQDEITYSGIEDYLALQGNTKLSSTDISDYLVGSGVKIGETVLGAPPAPASIKQEGDKWVVYRPNGKVFAEYSDKRDAIDAQPRASAQDSSPPKYKKWAPDGGIPGTYRETLITLPATKPVIEQWNVIRSDGLVDGAYDTEANATRRAEAINGTVVRGKDVTLEGGFRSSHWEQPNIVVHIRTDEVNSADGKRYLRVIEVQSDWGQKGKKEGFALHEAPNTLPEIVYSTEAGGWVEMQNGLRMSTKVHATKEAAHTHQAAMAARRPTPRPATRTEGVPAAPFVTDTKAWVALGLKRAIQRAVSTGADGVVFVTGQQSADLYGLEKTFDTLSIRADKNSTWTLRGYKDGDRVVDEVGVPTAKLADYMGQDLADRLLATEPDAFGDKEISGEEMKSGGEGMKAFYDKIVPQVANDLLKKLGGGKVAPVEFGLPVSMDTSHQLGFTITPEMRAKVSEGLPLFQRRASFNPATLTTTLLKGADLSSVLHEAGHFYLEVLTRLASSPTAPQEIRADVDTAMKWFGITGATPESRLAKWNAMSLEEQRHYHEQWAQSYERWTMEGKAPSTEMQPVFSRFRAWMLNVYKSMEAFLAQNPLAGKLNDEVREVFSRMLASEDAIKRAEQLRSYAPLFESVDQAQTSARTFDAYIRLGEDATDSAVVDMQNRSMRDMKWASNAKDKAIKALQAKAEEARKDIRAQVANEVAAEPINQARSFLKSGTTIDPNTHETIQMPGGYKLDTEALKAMYPATSLGNPDLTKIRGLTGKDGLHPDLVAQMFGFTSGDALVRQLAEAGSMKDKIEGMTDQRMLEEHGELVDQASVERAAESAVHNEVRAKFLATGLKMLTKTAIPVRTINAAAKIAAANIVAGKKVRDLRPQQYTAAETKANKEALRLAPTDPKGAANAQRDALLNNRLAKASGEAAEEIRKIIAHLKTFENLGTRKNIDMDYMDQIDQLLAPFDLSTGITFAEIDKRKSMMEWVADQEAQGFQPAIDAETIEKSKRKSYKDMTVEELRGFADTIAQVEHIGRMKKKLLTARDAREFATRIALADASIRANANRTVTERATPSDTLGKAAKLGRWLAASHRKFSSITREMDGGKDGGEMWELLSRPANEAADKETTMKAEASHALAAIFKPVQKIINEGNAIGNLYSRRTVVPGTTISMTHEERVMFGMNWGNEGNRQRLLDGGLTGRKALSSTEAQAILDTLTKPEWDFIQSTLDYLGSYKEQIAEQERVLTGVEPKMVDPAPIVTKFGTYAGGYFPAKYDTNMSTRSTSLEAVTTMRMGMKGAFGAATTRNGYTKERAAAVIGRPLFLNYDVITRHVNEVVHRLAWQRWLTDANRILRALDNPIREHYGPEILKELQDAVVDTASGDAPASSPLEHALNHLRIGSTIAGLGWRVTTALQQPSGLAQSWSRVGGKWIAMGVADYVKAPNDSAAFARSKSAFMHDRANTMYREINEVMNVVRTGEKMNAVKASFFSFIAKMQSTVDIPTWLGAYEKALAEQSYQNAPDEATRKTIEDRAVALADQAVKDSQSSGLQIDQAKIQRGSPALKLFTNFYSYFSATYNLNVEAYRRTDFHSPSEVGLFAVDMLILNTVPALFGYALQELMKGNCNGDLECLSANLGRAQANFLFSQMIPLREVGAAAEVAMGGPSYGYGGPAGLRFFNDLYKLSQQAEQGDADIALFKAANSVGGALLHYPSGQINSTTEGIIAVQNGDVQGVSIIPALISGPPRK